MPEPIPADQLSITVLNEGSDVSDFSCKDLDLVDFLKEDAWEYQKARLAVTYLCLFQNRVVGYVTLAADSIKLADDEKKQFAENKSRLHEFPGIKIARLAIHADFQKRHLGTNLIMASLGKIVESGKNVGCRFATVDAMPDAEAFYQKLGFTRNLYKQERSRNTVSMRYDLLHYPG